MQADKAATQPPRILAVLVLLALGACAPTPPPLPSGPWGQLNTGQWAASAAELEALPK